MKIIYSLSFVSLLAGWLLPIHFRPWVTSYQEFIAAISLFLLLFILIKNKINYINKTDFIILSLAIIPALQYSQNWIVYYGDALYGLVYILLFWLSVFAARNIENNQDGVNFQAWLGWTFVIGAVLSLIVAILQWLKISEGANIALFTPLRNSRPYANLAQPNNLATLFGFGLAGVFYLFENQKIKNYLALVLASLLVFGLALTQSRTTWVVAAFLPIFWFWQSRRMSLRTTCRQVLLLVAAALTGQAGEGLSGAAQATSFTDSWVQTFNGMLTRFYDTGTAAGGQWGAGFLATVQGGVPGQLIAILVGLVTPGVMAAMAAQGSRTGAQ